MSQDNQRHKSFFLASVSVGVLCLLFYVYLCFLEARSDNSPFVNSKQQVVYRKPLTDEERVAECKKVKACRLLGEVGYFEARGEKTDVAIAGPMFVALNRRDNPRYWGNSLRKVVYAPWQFSYTHDGSLERGIKEKKAYERVLKIAHYVWSGEEPDPTNGADHYHSTKVSPVWKHKLKKTVKLGSHIYYRKG